MTRREWTAAVIGCAVGAAAGTVATATAFLGFGDLAVVGVALTVGLAFGAIGMAHLRANDDIHWRRCYNTAAERAGHNEFVAAAERADRAKAERDLAAMRATADRLARQLEAEQAKHHP